MDKIKQWILVYLLLLLFGFLIAGFLTFYGVIKIELELIRLAVFCFVFGGIGGVIHCLRSFYIHYSHLKNWDSYWDIWYFLRPIISATIGIISLLFLKAGLLLFSDEITDASSKQSFAFVSVAFLAGYNVNNFLKKIEEISKTSLGISKRKSSNED